MLSRKSLFLILLICVTLIVVRSFAKDVNETYVLRVIDGDTVALKGGQRVRYIGIDTPEKGRPYYLEAKKENERLVLGKKVRLEFDVEKQDKYGRTLAYVYVGNVFINAELVKNGYAMVYTCPPNVKYAKTFLALQREARKAKRGLWGLR
ncbi:MAG: thermonuclease family protein [Candidatus Omnitrophota bacterium]